MRQTVPLNYEKSNALSGLSSGTAVSFGVDATAQPYRNENAAYFALTTLCWPILYFVAWKYTTTTNYMKEDSVIVPVHVRKEMVLEGAAVHGATSDEAEQEQTDEKKGVLQSAET